jgi:phenylacetate-coenzyme A ligase PaaK-like adenylate-forming protein
VAFVGVIHGHHAGLKLISEAPRLFYNVLPVSINSPLQEVVDALNRFQPDILTGYASGIHLIAEQQLAGTLHIHPRFISCSAEPLTPGIRAAVKKAFGVDPIDIYSLTECLALTFECNQARRMHFIADWVCVEVLDQEARPVPPGEPGTVHITSLYNHTQPLVRYRTNDQVEVCEAPCTCGSPYPAVKRIIGRQEEYLWFTKKDGTAEFIHPIMIVAFHAPGLKRHQIVQTSKDRFVLNAVVEGDSGQARSHIEAAVHGLLEEKGLMEEMSFRIRIVDHIPNDPKTGKFRLIIPFKG